MAQERARIQLILEYVEEHPEKLDDVRNKLKSLLVTHRKACEEVGKFTKASEEKTKAMRNIWGAYRKQKAALVPLTKAQEIAVDAIAGAREEQEETAKKTVPLKRRLEVLSSKFMTASYRVGWFAFRMMIAGRVLMRYLMKPVREGIKVLTNWEKSLENVASTLGLMAAAGTLTAKREAMMLELIPNLVEQGIAFQAAWSYLQSVLMNMAVSVAPTLIPVLYAVADALLSVWEQVEPVLIPALENLASTVIPPLISLIERVGPALITGFVSGLSVALPLIIGLLNALAPLAPTIGKIIGFLAPFAPLLIAAGVAAYFLSPILMAIAVVIKLLAIVAPVASGGIVAFGTALGAAGAAAAPAIPVILAIGAAALMVGAGFLAAGAGVWLAVDAIIRLTGVIGGLQALVAPLLGIAAGLLGIAAAGLGLLPATLGIAGAAVAILALAGAVGALAASFLALAAAAKAVEAVGGVIESVTSAVGGFVGAIFGSPSTVFADVTKDIQAMKREIGGFPAGPAFGVEAPTRVGEQHVTVYADIAIGSVTGEADLDMVQESVNRGIAEALRRRIG